MNQTSLLLGVLSGFEGFQLGLEQSPADSVERITSWFHCFLWTFSLGIAQLSKYNCHMLIHFGSVGILGKTPMLVACGLADYVGQGCGFYSKEGVEYICTVCASKAKFAIMSLRGI